VRSQDQSTLSLPATMLALPPLSLFFLADWLQGWFAWRGSAPAVALPADIGASDASARLLILAASLALVAVVYLVVLRFFADVLDEFGPRMRRWVLGWYAGGITLGAIWVMSGWGQVTLSDQLGANFLPTAITSLDAAAGGNDTLFGRFEVLMTAMRLVAMLAAGIVVTGAVSCLASPLATLGQDEERAYIRRQRARLHGYVSASSVLLVSTIVWQVAWMRWPSVVLGEARGAYLGQIESAAIYSGVTASAVIACFAIPVASILSARAAALPRVDGEEPEPALFDQGLADTLGKVLVVAAPAIASALPALAEGVGLLR